MWHNYTFNNHRLWFLTLGRHIRIAKTDNDYGNVYLSIRVWRLEILWALNENVGN